LLQELPAADAVQYQLFPTGIVDVYFTCTKARVCVHAAALMLLPEQSVPDLHEALFVLSSLIS